MKKTIVLKLLSALFCAASALFFGIYGAYQWALWRVAHPVPGEASSIGIISGSDGPTAIFVTVGPMEVYLAAGAAFLAGALGLFLWARNIGKRSAK